jgi:hypothetical protein
MSTPERMVEKKDDPRRLTGKVIGASEDGTELAVLWSDMVVGIEKAESLTDYAPPVTHVIRTRSKAPLMIVSITDRSYLAEDDPGHATTLVRCAGYAYSAGRAAARIRTKERARLITSEPGPRTRWVVRPIEAGKVTVELS